MRFDNHENIDKVFSQKPYLDIKFQPKKEEGKDFQIKLMPQEKWHPGVTSYYVAFLQGKLVKSLSEIPATSRFEFSRINIEWTDKLEEAVLFQSYETIDILRRFKGVQWEGLQLRLSYASGCNWKPETIDQFPAQKAVDLHSQIVYL